MGRTKKELNSERPPSANDPDVVRDEARVLGLLPAVRTYGWDKLGSTGLWMPARYEGNRLVAAPVERARASQAIDVLFKPRRTGEVLEPRVVRGAEALEYVSYLKGCQNLPAAFKAMAKLRYRLNEACDIGLTRAVGKALGELDRVEANARWAQERIDRDCDHFCERIVRKLAQHHVGTPRRPFGRERWQKTPLQSSSAERDPRLAVRLDSLAADSRTAVRWPELAPDIAKLQRGYSEVAVPVAELWVAKKIRAILEDEELDLCDAVALVHGGFDVFGSARRSNPVVLLDALLSDATSPFLCEGARWSQSTALRLWFRASHAPDVTGEERRLSVILDTARRQGKPLAQDAIEWWGSRSVLV